MKRIFIAVALALTSCTTVPTAPAVVANQTVLDERAAVSVELLYKGARTAVELAVDTGVLRGTRASQAAALDNRAFAAVTAVRTAYRAGNATNYAAATAEANTVISDLLAFIR